jgi:RNA polymerase sigma-70 factor, ECF subfamily
MANTCNSEMRVEQAGQSVCETTTALLAQKGSVEFAEEQLVAEAQGGSFSAFERLVERYETRVLRMAQRIAHSREDAEEITQDAFVQVFKNLAGFRGASRFYTWLGRITINQGLMKVRRRRMKEISIDDAVESDECILPREVEDLRPNPEERYSQQELHRILAETIAQLSPAYRVVLQLRDVEGFSIQETADALDVSPTAVKSRLCRARLQLRRLLDRYLKPSEKRDLAAAFVTGNRQRVDGCGARACRPSPGS